jgi:hypothetical protein
LKTHDLFFHKGNFLTHIFICIIGLVIIHNYLSRVQTLPIHFQKKMNNTTIEYTTQQTTIRLSGSLIGPDNHPLVRIVWDNITTDDGGIIKLDLGNGDESSHLRPKLFGKQPMLWQSSPIPVKPGKNEILITATDVHESVFTQRIIAFHPIARPIFRDILVGPATVKVYEKFEMTFQLDTVADNPFFQYDPSPPSGVSPRTGITVTAEILTPSGKIHDQPAFFTTDAIETNINGRPFFYKSPVSHWAIRYSPSQVGPYQITLSAVDRSGTTRVKVGNFTAISPDRPGFVQVSKADPRYFEFSNGSLFWPLGPAIGPDYSKYPGTGINLDREWLAGTGAYSTNFARWVSSAQTMGNEGFDSQLSFKEHYPSHELSQEIAYPNGWRMWIGWSSGETYQPRLISGTTYLVKIRLKTSQMKGPQNPQEPFGFVIKTGGWPSTNFINDHRGSPSMIPEVSKDTDWHTIIATYTPQGNPDEIGPYIYLYLENVTAGRVYIDDFSIRPINSDGSLAGEMVVNASADLFSYVEPGPAAYIDWMIGQGEEYGIYFKFVVLDKRDWIPAHISRNGQFVDQGDGFFQPDGTKARWLQKQWWRYLIARWGYSTAIQSWEFVNEGPPDDQAFYQATQDFARFMHENDPHYHLVTTSFWSGWHPDFWENPRYPDIDYADLHEYLRNDLALNFFDHYLSQSEEMYASSLHKPIMIGETGLGAPGDSIFQLLSQPNSGDWFHILLWSQLAPSSVSSPNYWWTDHLSQFDRLSMVTAFSHFISNLDLNKGGYQDAKPSTDNPGLITLGQKNLKENKAYLWILNQPPLSSNDSHLTNFRPDHTHSIQVSLQMSPSIEYQIQRWDTDRGSVIATFTLISDSNGNLTIPVNSFGMDAALLITQE